MSKEAVSNVSYPVAPGTTVLLTIDGQFGSEPGIAEALTAGPAAG